MIRTVVRCWACDREFRTAIPDALLCPACQTADDRIYANDPRPYVETPGGWEFSKAAMRERLGVTGDDDE